MWIDKTQKYSHNVAVIDDCWGEREDSREVRNQALPKASKSTLLIPRRL